MDVAHAPRVWRDRPATAVPPWSGRGRQPTKVQLTDAAPAPIRGTALAIELPSTAGQPDTIKAGSQGPRVAEFAFHRVVAVREGLPGPEVWLVLRRSLRDGARKPFRSNAPADIAATRLVRPSGMRWPIATCFAVGKQDLGMGDDAVRSGRGWHHHMTLVILALGFLVRLQGRFAQTLRR